MISPTVLKISPHMDHDIPHGTAHTLYRVQIKQADFPNWVCYKQVLIVSYFNACPFCYFKYHLFNIKLTSFSSHQAINTLLPGLQIEQS